MTSYPTYAPYLYRILHTIRKRCLYAVSSVSNDLHHLFLRFLSIGATRKAPLQGFQRIDAFESLSSYFTFFVNLTANYRIEFLPLYFNSIPQLSFNLYLGGSLHGNALQHGNDLLLMGAYSCPLGAQYIFQKKLNPQ